MDRTDKVVTLIQKGILGQFEKEHISSIYQETPEEKELISPIHREDSEEENFNYQKKEEFLEKLKPEAYHGIAGEIVRRIEPHTEADNAALLINFLVGIGNLIGRGAYFTVESKHHHVRFFAALVGKTSKGRKGSSWGHIKRILERVDPVWASKRIKSGLSSGEGLISQVRDDPDDVLDKLDKRLLILEEEFATALRVAERPGNTLTAVIRQAWDSGDIGTLTKVPFTATRTHVSILAHVTKDELRKYLTTTEIGNGFANRFLWTIVQRSKILPEGGSFHLQDIDDLVNELISIVEFSNTAGEIVKDNEATQIWAHVYEQLSDGIPGLVGAVTSRAEAQTMRLACLYALLDKSKVIRPVHLKAALAVWDYSFASARYIFGQELGNPIANEILKALQEKQSEGMTRTDISKLFSRKKTKDELDLAIKLLIENGLIVVKTEETKGRPVHRAFLL